MHKALNDAARALFAEQIAARHPGLKLRRSLRGLLPGAVIFEQSLDHARLGWIAFAGFKEVQFGLALGWTRSGRKLGQLEEWGRETVAPFRPLPVPADGMVDLRDRFRFEAEPPSPYHVLQIVDPTADLQARIHQAYIATPEFEQDVARSYAGALKIHTRNPPSADANRQQAVRAERALCQLWSHLFKRHAFGADEIDGLVRPPVMRAVELVEEFGLPFLELRLQSGVAPPP